MAPHSRSLTPNRLVTDYILHIKASDGHAIRREDMLKVIDLVCPRQIKSLAALDTATENHGRLNFDCLRTWSQELSEWALSKPNLGPARLEALNVTILDLRKNLLSSEIFLKSRLDGLHHESHLGAANLGINDGPASHCAFYAFGKRDPRAMDIAGCLECGHVHTTTCPQCDEMWRTITIIDKLVVQAEALAPSSSSGMFVSFHLHNISLSDFSVPLLFDTGAREDPVLEQLLTAVKYHKERYKFYVGHQARLCHEAKSKEEIIAFLKANHDCVAVNCDFAMKVLPSSYRETMASWFGKKGIAYHGMSLVWWNPEKNCLDM